MSIIAVKEEASRLIEKLPDDATWEDVMRAIYVRQTIESGLADSEAGRVRDVDKVRTSRVAPNLKSLD